MTLHLHGCRPKEVPGISYRRWDEVISCAKDSKALGLSEWRRSITIPTMGECCAENMFAWSISHSGLRIRKKKGRKHYKDVLVEDLRVRDKETVRHCEMHA